MIIEAIHLKNFLSHTDSRVDFTDAAMWLISGDNGSGKSALFDAVEYALYGQHRGGGSGDRLLVKHGAGQALVQVVIALDSGRYRITRHLHERDGNKGGSIEEWLAEAGVWQPVTLSGGVGAAWKWLEGRLPDHALFRSAIFLRQNETAFFLNRNASDRQRLFARIIKLDRYTEFSNQAKRREDAARTLERAAAARLQALGDVSEAAEQALSAALAEAAAREGEARAAHTTATAASDGAREWNRLHQERSRMVAEQAANRELLAAADTITRDHQLVSAWDRDAARLSDFWRNREGHEQQQQQAERRRQAAEAAGQEAARYEEECTARQADLDDLSDHQLPDLHGRYRAESARQQALALEARIAEARADLTRADAAVALHAGKDTALKEWDDRHRSLPHLAALAAARQALAEQQQALANAEAALTLAEQAAIAAARRLAAGETAAAAAERERDGRGEALARLEAECYALRSRLQGHRALGGSEAVCPTCDQPLDAAAHAHLQTVLADEVAELERLEGERERAGAARDAAEQERGRLEREVATARQAARQAENAHGQALSRRDGLSGRVRDEQARVETAQAAVLANCSYYVPALADISSMWLAGERAVVEQGLSQARAEAEALRQALADQQRARTAHATLHEQRAPGAEAHGDTLDLALIRRLEAEAGQSARTITATITRLEEEQKRLNAAVGDLRGRAAGKRAEQAAEQQAADQAATRAREHGAEVDRLLALLASAWAEVLTERAAYDARAREVDQRRESAARIIGLSTVEGALVELGRQSAAIEAALACIPEDHRLTLEEAQERLARALTDFQAAGNARSTAEHDLASLHERRARAEQEAAALNAAHERATTFRMLADLLKENGAIQNAVVTRTQRELAQEVNNVLDLLGDPLAVLVGDPRRAGAVGAQTIQVVDRTDPAGRPRHFEYLSGGEQFRVAMALALALHRRVGERAGTLIVDEGFGALDAHRRDALAHQMTEQSQGILSLGLARNIIICSHSTEVQRHFPHRWQITKRDGSAIATRAATAEDDTDG